MIDEWYMGLEYDIKMRKEWMMSCLLFLLRTAELMGSNVQVDYKWYIWMNSWVEAFKIIKWWNNCAIVVFPP